MGPRPIGRGFGVDASGAVTVAAGFHGAASDRTRIQCLAGRTEYPIDLLQWGRVRSDADSRSLGPRTPRTRAGFNGAASDRTRIRVHRFVERHADVASMGPRPIGRGFQPAG